ncbi:GATA zinc finger domain-containing protein 14-like [Phymastichus coffea]|uniref:GATA zinc finger domain-containing protein 14-like n=1 Tax=Phymastichus coffea TaxID=108790 RepID=UPI00273C05F0|nr:GATA zinc finger domain-containing protein 14-like [Phymastichus coffea]
MDEVARINALLGEDNQNNNLADNFQQMDIDNHNEELERLARAGNGQQNRVQIRPPNLQENAQVPVQQIQDHPVIFGVDNEHLHVHQNDGIGHHVHHPEQLNEIGHANQGIPNDPAIPNVQAQVNDQVQANRNAVPNNAGRAVENAGFAGQQLGPLQNIPVNQQNNVPMQGSVMRLNRNRNNNRRTTPYAAVNSQMRRNASRMATFLWNMAKECTYVPNRNDDDPDNQENNNNNNNN